MMHAHQIPHRAEDLHDRLFRLFQDKALLLSTEQLQAIRASLDQVVNYHATVGVLGKTGAGKSALCNALFGKDVAEVSDIDACTRAPQEITLSLKQGKGISLIDMPGVGESEQRDAEYAALYRRLLPELDLVLWVIKGDDRALSVDQRFYHNVVLPLIQAGSLPVVFVISQVDKIEPFREWDWKQNRPSPCQTRNIDAKLTALHRTFGIARSQLCAVSAEEAYGLVELVETIVSTLPDEKKWSFTREAHQDTVSAQARQVSEQGLWETIKGRVAEILQGGWERVSVAVGSLVEMWWRSRG